VLAHKNILRVVHLPVQSGSDFMLRKMHRGYTVSDFVYKVNEIRKRCPDMQIVTDIMVGFCGETDSDFEASVNLVKAVKPSDINVYKFSMRQHTYAYKHYDDDVDEALKVYRYNYMKQLVSQLR
jgi:tRNA A37 methylthiotransferase MiaB